jgi:hypothetical protein
VSRELCGTRPFPIMGGFEIQVWLGQGKYGYLLTGIIHIYGKTGQCQLLPFQFLTIRLFPNNAMQSLRHGQTCADAASLGSHKSEKVSPYQGLVGCIGGGFCLYASSVFIPFNSNCTRLLKFHLMAFRVNYVLLTRGVSRFPCPHHSSTVVLYNLRVTALVL